jgi:hypothetical protein
MLSIDSLTKVSILLTINGGQRRLRRNQSISSYLAHPTAIEFPLVLSTLDSRTVAPNHLRSRLFLTGTFVLAVVNPFCFISTIIIQ